MKRLALFYILWVILFYSCNFPPSQDDINKKAEERALVIADSISSNNSRLFFGIKTGTRRDNIIRDVKSKKMPDHFYKLDGGKDEFYYFYSNKQLEKIPWMESFDCLNDTIYSVQASCFQAILSDASSLSMRALYDLMIRSYTVTYGDPFFKSDKQYLWINAPTVIKMVFHSDDNLPYLSITHTDSHLQKRYLRVIVSVKFEHESSFENAYTTDYYSKRLIMVDTSLRLK